MENHQQPTSTQVVKRDPASVEFVPYGAQDKIKLTISVIQNLVAVRTKSGATCSDRDAIRFMAMCQAKRINPFEGDCFLIGYDSREGATFSLVTAHQTYLKRAELHPEFDGMRSGIIVKDEDGTLKDLEGDFFAEGQEVVGGWATVYFKNRKQPMHKRLRLERFQKAYGVWQEDAAGMICKCAEADALRSSFPTMLGGLFMREELPGPDAQSRMTKPSFDGKSQLFTPSSPAEIELPAAGSAPIAPNEPPNPDDGDLQPQPEPEQQQQQPAAPATPLKALRTLLKLAKVKEGELLDYLAVTGASDGSFSTLEEIQLSQSQVIQATHDNWKELEADIKARRPKA